jgi:GTP cyclohydrolase IA
MNCPAHALVPSFEIDSAGIKVRLGRVEVEGAIRTVVRWIGDDPQRNGLVETPTRVVARL